MINLKLAEYKDGKFQSFLELCKTELLVNYNFEIKINEEGFLFGRDCIIKISHGIICLSEIETFYKDEKDPLNRLGGLFDGRTYGEGDFVLIKDDEDDIYQCYDVYERWHRRKGDVNSSELTDYDNEGYSDEDYRICENQGNLHENPELYEKIK
jgi:hypothetical protein